MDKKKVYRNRLIVFFLMEPVSLCKPIIQFLWMDKRQFIETDNWVLMDGHQAVYRNRLIVFLWMEPVSLWKPIIEFLGKDTTQLIETDNRVLFMDGYQTKLINRVLVRKIS